MNEISKTIDLLRDVPPTLVLAWGGWLVIGVALAVWQVKARTAEQEQARLQAAARKGRTKSGVRSLAGAKAAVRPPKAAPVDAFGELQALLEPSADGGNLSRRPGD